MLVVNKFKLIIAIANWGGTATELAEESGISQVTIARFKAGTQRARTQTIGRIARTLGVKVEELI